MKRILLSILACLSLVSLQAADKKTQELSSPDGRITVTFDNFKYSVVADGVTVLAPSSIAMLISDGTMYGPGAKLQKTNYRSGDRVIKADVYKRSRIHDRYNEMELVYKDFSLIFRAYDEGVAYRFVSGSKKGFNVVTEKAHFTFPDNWMAYVPYLNSKKKNLEEQLFCSFENVYSHINIKDWDSSRGAFLPLVVEVPGGMKVAITEADLFDYPGLNICNMGHSLTLEGYHARAPKSTVQGGHNMLQGIVNSREPFVAMSCRPGAVFPWRVIQISRNDTELAESDLVYKLAQDPEKRDWSWVKPGKVAWDWWNDWNLYGVDFEAGINNETYKYYIDFASEHGIEYVILDEGWAVNKKADLFQVIPEIDVRELVEYGARKNVGIILWAGTWAVDRNMEEVFRYYSAMGVKGFKIDFMNRDDQDIVNFYTRCAQYGAKYRMMVDFHGAYKPTGLHRTFPNVVNFEGVHGLEHMKWATDDAQIEYDVTVPYIRMLAGPMDYTQGAMHNVSKENYSPSNSEPMSLGTRCRQLAEYVIFDAPLTMLCDSPSNYMREPECTEYIAGVPTVWNETMALDGKIGKYIVMARRSGNDWYIGALTDWTPRELEIDLSFLPKGSYKAVIFKDGKNAAKAARDYVRESTTVNSGDILRIHLAPGGGWTAKLEKL
ncbi:MAG: glycoside hydrolase family 97 protein [Bacteroidales bacterium]|nr:glycoside hydrolase family 97 protein [Bacteroidales bacterium]